jgi:CRISPR-associated endoribonuclease Cas6
MDLLSLVLTLRLLPTSASASGTQSESGEAQWLGRAAHAIVLDCVRRADPALAEAIHAGSGLRPFTASGLIGASPRYALSAERTYHLRLTALTAPVASALVLAAQAGPLSPGEAVTLAETRFSIVAADWGTPAISPSKEPMGAGSQNIWAAATTYESLSAPWLLGRQRPAPRLSLQFSSPTTFKSEGKHVPVPLPGWVFGSLLEKWNAFAPVALPPEARRFADECLALTSYRLSTRMLPIKENGLRAGAVGQARYTALNADRYWLSLMHLLADFALFAGVGAGTSMGLGQARKLAEGSLRRPKEF